MKSILSHHEIAHLLLLLSGPGQVSRTDPDAIALQQAQLVEVASEASFERGLRLTAAGKEVLRRLGIDAA